jgi:glucokinase
MTHFKEKTMILAGDIGGTKTHLGLFAPGQRRPQPQVIQTFSSPKAPDLESIIRQFLEIHPASVTHACFGIAGPVVNGMSKITNLPWNVSEARIQEQFNFDHVRMLNDVAATALAIPLLNSHEFFPLNQAEPIKGQNLALIAPGTGLGIAMMVYQNDQYVPVPSEGGHADFAPNNEAEDELWRFLHGRCGHVSIERVVSGSGLVNIYRWLKYSNRLNEPDWLRQKLNEPDPAKTITELALANKDVGCIKALNMFVCILGAVAGNLALTGMTTGGVYLGGGIPPKILSKLKDHMFIQAFTNKGRFKELLENIPVTVILNDKAALMGAAHCAAMLK